MKSLLVAASVLGLVGFSGAADAKCMVTDPTGTPLNIRSTPQGAVVGTIDNGAVVEILERQTDAKGKPWVYIATRGGRPIGWVFREFVSCL